MAEPRPHPANGSGDFYVEDGCCTMCGVPFFEAPSLFGVIKDPKGYSHCYVKRQPSTGEELAQMISAVRCAELQCIRYRGSDTAIQLRLVEIGDGLVCDHLPPDLQQRAELIKAARRQRSWWYVPVCIGISQVVVFVLFVGALLGLLWLVGFWSIR